MKISLEEIKKLPIKGLSIQTDLATYHAQLVQRSQVWDFYPLGLYSIPAFGSEWYSRNMYIQGTAEFEHRQNL